MDPEDKRDTSPYPNPTSTAMDPTTLDPTRLGGPGELIGQLLHGRYSVEAELKRGGMGVVYLGRDQQLHGRPVVVKVLLDEAFQSEYVVQKFRQEVEALSRIDHPGIVGIIDVGELPNGRPFIVMQYVEGVTLRSVINAEGMNLERVAEIVRQLGRALSAAHSRGVYHRDLKPDNIMLQDLGRGEEQVKIIDFGVAKVKSSMIAPSTSLNLSPGTVAYMAPEQLNGRPITPATDIFAMGAVAYEMVTGRKPFNPETGFQLLKLHESGVRVKPADLRPGLTRAAEAAIIKALAYNPSDRFSEPRDFGDQFARSLLETDEPREDAQPPLPVTQLSSEETPLARNLSPQNPPTMPAPFQAAQNVPFSTSDSLNPSAEDLGFTSRTGKGTGKGRLGLAVGLIVLVLAAVGTGSYFLLSRKAAGTEATPAGPVAQRNLNYWLTVQKMREGRAYQDPFTSSGQEIFENGWKFRLNARSDQQGHLYLLNEGPGAAGEITYNVLFPAPSNNDGSPFLKAAQDMQTGWMVFDDNQGTEKFWMIWSAEPVSELEAVKDAVNPDDKGEVKDAAEKDALKKFLALHSKTAPHVEKDKANKQTNLKAQGTVLVHQLELEHH